ncbi:hypothetical protein RJT34_12520 [Clitoria ternatea]|uniref:Uncharacterized protein n=1 Tax=Clitoria ternatea TaxID=43366 RepID=A0AAN9JLV2_CLITE
MDDSLSQIPSSFHCSIFAHSKFSTVIVPRSISFAFVPFRSALDLVHSLHFTLNRDPSCGDHHPFASRLVGHRLTDKMTNEINITDRVSPDFQCCTHPNHVFSLISAVTRVFPGEIDNHSKHVFEDLISIFTPCLLSRTDDVEKLLKNQGINFVPVTTTIQLAFMESIGGIPVHGKKIYEHGHADGCEMSPYHEESNNMEPMDFKNNYLLWLPPESEDEKDDKEVVLFDDNEDEGVTGEWGYLRSSISFGSRECRSRDKLREDHRKAMKNVVEGQLLQVENLTKFDEDGQESWLDIITILSYEAATLLKPFMSRGRRMDPGGYVKEMENLKMVVVRIDAYHPNVLLVEKSVSRYAQEYLLSKDISLVLNIKKPLLERIAYCTGA